MIIHYSLVACSDDFVSEEKRNVIRDFKGYKAVFIQDDYRFINKTVNALAFMKINALLTLADSRCMEQIYPSAKLPGVRKETVLTGYVPEHLVKLEVPAFLDRPIDVGYRARKLPAWLGSHTLQKWQIGEKFSDDANRYNLSVDISCREEDRIYGQDWIRFICNCKAVLGTESGVSLADYAGEIQKNVEEHLIKYPGASFDVLKNLYFSDQDGNIDFSVISPRCFEAASLRTLMILYEGYYSGRLLPWRHYVPLKKDHSNMAEVVSVLRDPVRAQEIINSAYSEVALNQINTYGAMVEIVDRVFDEEIKIEMLSTRPPYDDIRFEIAQIEDSMLPRKVKKAIVEQLEAKIKRFITSFIPSWLKPAARAIYQRGLWPIYAKIRYFILRNVGIAR